MNEAELKNLILFRDFSDNETVRKAVSLFSEFNRDSYIFVQREMADSWPELTLNRTCWQNYIVDILARSENIFSLSAEKSETITDTPLWNLAALEFKTVIELYHLDFRSLVSSVDKFHKDTATVRNLTDTKASGPVNNHRRMEIVAALESKDPDNTARCLYGYWRKYGAGILENHFVFEWNSGLTGLKNYDRVSLNDLIGYENEKALLVENTKFLLNGKKAANVLLYGDSGTGKSSSVKGLITEFGQTGLKLIDISKNQIRELPFILESISDRGSKFIIFIDDLSFEENEVEYKYFKSILEGTFKCRGDNAVIYVTSNRRNIVREVWSERENSDDIHLRDTLQEKKSLADRFGLVITYGAPSKDEYLEIVKGLARQREMTIDDELLTEALKWDLRRGGRSGRTAKYFIEYYNSKR